MRRPTPPHATGSRGSMELGSNSSAHRGIDLDELHAAALGVLLQDRFRKVREGDGIVSRQLGPGVGNRLSRGSRSHGPSRLRGRISTHLLGKLDTSDSQQTPVWIFVSAFGFFQPVVDVRDRDAHAETERGRDNRRA